MSYTKHFINTLKDESPLLYKIVNIHFLIALLCILGLLIDDRTLLGVNVWIKPLKFCLSGAIYISTVGFLTTFYPYSNRKRKFLNNSIAWAMIIDLGIILCQGARGVQSHYNIHNPLDAILFSLLGIITGYVVLTMVLFIFDSIRLKMKTTKSIQLAIIIGWLIVFFGSWIGGQMISQMSHTVGAVDGGTGLPLVNWSTIAGDLRIGHFFGLHGIQIVPLFAFWLSNKWKTNSRNQIIAVAAFGLLYAGWIAYIFLQAKQGIPMFAST